MKEIRPAALFFGSIGTLIDSHDLHRRAYNAAFSEAGLDWIWDPALYAELCATDDGKPSIEAFAEDRGLVVDGAVLRHRKSQIFAEIVRDQGASPRPGVLGVISAAAAAAVPLALVTTAQASTVDAIFDAAGGVISRRSFAFVGNADMAAPKPETDIYRLALSSLRLRTDQVIAIEDTVPCFEAARQAGLETVAFPRRVNGIDYTGARAVARSLSPEIVGLGVERSRFAHAL